RDHLQARQFVAAALYVGGILYFQLALFVPGLGHRLDELLDLLRNQVRQSERRLAAIGIFRARRRVVQRKDDLLIWSGIPAGQQRREIVEISEAPEGVADTDRE